MTAPNKQCALDPVPTRIVTLSYATLIPFITYLLQQITVRRLSTARCAFDTVDYSLLLEPLTDTHEILNVAHNCIK